MARVKCCHHQLREWPTHSCSDLALGAIFFVQYSVGEVSIQRISKLRRKSQTAYGANVVIDKEAGVSPLILPPQSLDHRCPLVASSTGHVAGAMVVFHWLRPRPATNSPLCQRSCVTVDIDHVFDLSFT